jgi:recombination protein RecA
LVQKSGSFFSYEGERLGQGRNNAKVFLREHPPLMDELEGKIYESLGLERVGGPPRSAIEELSGEQGEAPGADDPQPQEQAA